MRFGYIFAISHEGIDYSVPKFDAFVKMAEVFDRAFQDVLRSVPAEVAAQVTVDKLTQAPKTTHATTRKTTDPLFNSGTRQGEKMTWWQMASVKRKDVRAAVLPALAAAGAKETFGLDVENGLEEFVESVIDAFFDNDLFHAVRGFLAAARGSFGLGITCSLDAGRQVRHAPRQPRQSQTDTRQTRHPRNPNP